MSTHEADALSHFELNDTTKEGIGWSLAYAGKLRASVTEILAQKDDAGNLVGYADPSTFDGSEADKALVAEYLRVETELVKTRKQSVDFPDDLEAEGEVLLAEITNENRDTEVGENIALIDAKSSKAILKGTPFESVGTDVADINSFVDGYQNLIKQAKDDDAAR